jgi:ribosome biogenesis protein BRX1
MAKLGNQISLHSEESHPAAHPEDEQDASDVQEATAEDFVSDGKYRNKQRCLVLCLRGATARYRHLLEDLRTLIPHHKKESKLDPGKTGLGRAVNDIAEMRSCNSVLFLECRKHQDAYMWLGRLGEKSGPSAKFHISNVHTMDELRLTGNCMKGSRPVLSFDESFQREPHLKLLKELFVDIFGTPRGHPKSKPFVDRVMAFYFADNKVSTVWIVQVIVQVPDYNS